MRVLFVCNNAYNRGNGLSTSVGNTIRRLRESGVDARLMSVRNEDTGGPQPDFPLEHFVFPIFEPIIRANGFCYAKINSKRIGEALDWADVIHLEEAFLLERIVRRMAQRRGKTCVATFHLYPHNITANLGLRKNNLLDAILIRLWREGLYNHCAGVQCPTQPVKEYLRKNGLKARLHVISNGIRIGEKPVSPEPVMPEEPIRILCIGRLAAEKAQNTLLEAMRFSRHAARIQLVFAGNGPKAVSYKKLAGRLMKEGVLCKEPVFGFYTQEQLSQLCRSSYLYVHCAWVEVEGLSCIEATREGLVPIIAEGPLIGTSQFALCPESRYPVGDSRALAQRIDWWIEHPQVRNDRALDYVRDAGNYSIDCSISALVEMYKAALDKK